MPGIGATTDRFLELRDRLSLASGLRFRDTLNDGPTHVNEQALTLYPLRGPMIRALGTYSVAGADSAASARRANAGSDRVPVFRMIAARWFSTVRWLMPRSAAIFLLG